MFDTSYIIGEKIYTIMNNQDSQQNNHSMSMYARVKSLWRKFGRVCVPTIDNGQAQSRIAGSRFAGVDYFVISDYDGLQLDSN